MSPRKYNWKRCNGNLEASNGRRLVRISRPENPSKDLTVVKCYKLGRGAAQDPERFECYGLESAKAHGAAFLNAADPLDHVPWNPRTVFQAFA